jgi:hypothetical protein
MAITGEVQDEAVQQGSPFVEADAQQLSCQVVHGGETLLHRHRHEQGGL